MGTFSHYMSHASAYTAGQSPFTVITNTMHFHNGYFQLSVIALTFSILYGTGISSENTDTTHFLVNGTWAFRHGQMSTKGWIFSFGHGR